MALPQVYKDGVARPVEPPQTIGGEAVVKERVARYSAYLRKPFREADLMKVIGAILPQ